MMPPEIALLIFIAGFIGWVFNKSSVCGSYLLGYFMVLVQGVGLGLLIEYVLVQIGWLI